jgi:hypothetical protein
MDRRAGLGACLNLLQGFYPSAQLVQVMCGWIALPKPREARNGLQSK